MLNVALTSKAEYRRLRDLTVANLCVDHKHGKAHVCGDMK